MFLNVGSNFLQEFFKFFNVHAIHADKCISEMSQIWVQCVEFTFFFTQQINRMHPVLSIYFLSNPQHKKKQKSSIPLILEFSILSTIHFTSLLQFFVQSRRHFKVEK